MPSTRPVILEAAYPQTPIRFSCEPAVPLRIERMLSAAGPGRLSEVLDAVARHLGARAVIIWRQDVSSPVIGVSSPGDRAAAVAYATITRPSYRPLAMDERVTTGSARLLPEALAARSLVQTGIPLETGASVSVAIATDREHARITSSIARLAIAIASRMSTRPRSSVVPQMQRCIEILETIEIVDGSATMTPSDFVVIDDACARKGAASFRHLLSIARSEAKLEKMRVRQAERARLSPKASSRPSQVDPSPAASKTTRSLPDPSISKSRRLPSRSI